MTESKKKRYTVRPSLGWAFLKGRDFAPPDLKAHLVFWSVLAVGLLLDLWSKNAVFQYLQRQQTGQISIIDGFLQLVIAENPGAAFGIAAGQRFLLIAVSVVALIVIFTAFFFSRTGQKSLYVVLGLFAAGVCGNLYDRISHHGTVRDFIDVVYWPGKHWPAFNIADSMLCLGVGLIIISSLRRTKRT